MKKHEISLEDTKEGLTIKSLLKYIENNMVKEVKLLLYNLICFMASQRPELFIQKDNVYVHLLRTIIILARFRSRPGIIVLINGTDWEVEGGLDYKIKSGDSIVFVSTLHGNDCQFFTRVEMIPL